ncbi:MAG: diacylglycerol kinase [Betaproteobacteria bacterium]
MNSPIKGRGGFMHAAVALGYSLKGLAAAWQREIAFRQEVLIGVPMLVASPWLAPDRTGLVLMIGSVLLVWFAELFNTALEAVCDAVSVEAHPLLGIAKDAGSAAVLLSLVGCAVTWTVLIVP